MAFVQKLDLRQSQNLVMTPQLQQAIKLLQMSNLEITDFIAQELQQNPLLEPSGASEADLPMPSNETPQDRLPATDSSAPAAAVDDQAAHIDAGALPEPAGDPDVGDAMDGRDTALSYGAGGGGFDGEISDLAERLSRAPSLRDHLYQQINNAFDEPGCRLIAAALIDAVDPNGYLSEGDATVAAVATQLNVDRRRVESVLALIQQFDPPGVMARSLAECLALQLRERDRYDPAMATLCANLELLAEHRFPELCRRCGVDSADLSDMIREIRALDPRPGARFEAESPQIVLPDILMRASQSGWIIELNPETLPRVLINRRYYAEINAQCRTQKDREYLGERLSAANWLLRSLDQRANTILKVATEIVAQQDAFFAHGVSHLRPLVLRNIAEIIGMHESTVSRVTSNKYMATPRGVFELKYFFSAAIQRADGEGSFAAESIRQRLKTLIDGEDPKLILSDDTLVEQLLGEGIEIARRTVAKYREQLGIPSSVRRRRQKVFDAADSR